MESSKVNQALNATKKMQTKFQMYFQFVNETSSRSYIIRDI